MIQIYLSVKTNEPNPDTVLLSLDRNTARALAARINREADLAHSDTYDVGICISGELLEALAITPGERKPPVRSGAMLVNIHHDGIEVNSRKRSGVPVVEGTRVTVAELIRELSEGRSILQIANDYDLDRERIVKCLEGLAASLDCPMVETAEEGT